LSGLLSVRPPLPPGTLARRPADVLPFPLSGARCFLYARARHALYTGVLALGLEAGDEVLLPAYHHGSEVEALLQAGLVPRWYAGGPDLQPDEAELERLVGPRTRALYAIHYLGFPQAADRWRQWCDERGLLLLEDAAQAWLATLDARPLGAFGDLAVMCLYKTFGFPDGATLVMRQAQAPPTRPAGRPGFALLAREAAWLISRSQTLAALEARRAASRPPYDARKDFALGEPHSMPSQDTLFLLPRTADPDAAARRRANYRQLLDALGDMVPAPFDALPETASPFGFPVAVADKAALLRHLDDRHVRGVNFWSAAHPALPRDGFEQVAARREQTVCLPVHQELRPDDVERIANATRELHGRRPQPMLDVDLLDDLEPLRPEWEELAGRGRNIFATWDWVSTWWRHFEAGHSLATMAVRERDGRLVGIVPLYRWRGRPLRTLRFLGHGAGDQLGPICDPQDRGRVARALRHALRGGHGWDLVLGEYLPASEGWSSLLAGHPLRRASSPVLRFGAGGWEEFLSSRSANFRGQVRTRERRLHRDHDATYRLVTDPNELDGALDALFRLHAARRPEGSSFVPREAFQRDFARRALSRGWLRLWLLEADGADRAAWYGFRFGDVESFYQSGRDPEWEHSSVGFVLLAHTIRAAADDGMTEYRHLRGGEPYKYRFSTHDPGLETIAVSCGAAGGAAVTGAAIVPRALARRATK
jgi:CelD/BcsL family acetyltransferase involved in cellulose biosynthesis